MLSLLTLILLLPRFNAQTTDSAHALDALLQDYAYMAFAPPRTGIPYEGSVPSNLTGIKIAAMRLRSGSLRVRGVKMYKEFVIPKGVSVHPYVERVVLVYQNLGNWSQRYYPLPGYTYIAPVLGLLAYDASNLSATNLSELNISASGDPLNITFPDCSFSSRWVNCEVRAQGHFSIVVESLAPSPAPASPAPSPPNVGPRPSEGGKKKKISKEVWLSIGFVLGGLLLLVLLSFLILWAQKLKQRKKHPTDGEGCRGGGIPADDIGWGNESTSSNGDSDATDH
ncbi:hypothetical protein OIU84_011009 [Salix udensis]|uniref:Uncharacterized protein n=1 Tax=Salix udensis TaxID=889485 RepID=A0AAD6JM74_9ROSI|nr:hypothetical protein OIU84_011009 [Salix udensis]